MYIGVNFYVSMLLEGLRLFAGKGGSRGGLR